MDRSTAILCWAIYKAQCDLMELVIIGFQLIVYFTFKKQSSEKKKNSANIVEWIICLFYCKWSLNQNNYKIPILMTPWRTWDHGSCCLYHHYHQNVSDVTHIGHISGAGWLKLFSVKMRHINQFHSNEIAEKLEESSADVCRSFFEFLSHFVRMKQHEVTHRNWK